MTLRTLVVLGCVSALLAGCSNSAKDTGAEDAVTADGFGDADTDADADSDADADTGPPSDTGPTTPPDGSGTG